MVEIEDWHWYLSKLFEVHHKIFVFLSILSLVAVDVELVQKKVICTDSVLLFRIYPEN